MLPLISITYLGHIQYYTKFLLADNIYIEQHENYSKQSYRNRCSVYGANGLQTLSIPVKKGNTLKTKIRDVRIDYKNDWQKNHWKTIESAYNASPFFEIYAPEFYPFYHERKYNYLFDYNLALLKLILNLLEIETAISFTNEYIFNTDLYHDYRESIHPKKRCKKEDSLFEPVVYYQVFSDKHGFKPNISIIDLLFNEGPQAPLILKDCVTDKIYK